MKAATRGASGNCLEAVRAMIKLFLGKKVTAKYNAQAPKHGKLNFSSTKMSQLMECKIYNRNIRF